MAELRPATNGLVESRAPVLDLGGDFCLRRHEPVPLDRRGAAPPGDGVQPAGMNLLPVAERELRLLARQPGTYRSRALIAATVILVSLGMLYAGFGNVLSAASAGKALFLLLSLVGGVYVLLEGAIVTADCLS